MGQPGKAKASPLGNGSTIAPGICCVKGIILIALLLGATGVAAALNPAE